MSDIRVFQGWAVPRAMHGTKWIPPADCLHSIWVYFSYEPVAVTAMNLRWCFNQQDHPSIASHCLVTMPHTGLTGRLGVASPLCVTVTIWLMVQEQLGHFHFGKLNFFYRCQWSTHRSVFGSTQNWTQNWAHLYNKTPIFSWIALSLLLNNIGNRWGRKITDKLIVNWQWETVEVRGEETSQWH